jgi:outer membrane protein TolC
MPPRRILPLLVATVSGLYAQTAGPSGPAPARAVPLPASGRLQPGTVGVSQTATPGTGVGTVDVSVSVTGDFAGSVPSQDVPNGPVALTLADAIKRGLRANLGALTADTNVRAARATRLQALSALLPNISIQASETATQVNLAAYGVQFKPPPGSNFSIPSVVGPFSYSSLAGTVSQSVWDPVQRRNLSAARESERASTLSAKDARELVVLAVAGTYLQTLADMSRLESQRAQVTSAQAVYDQAVTRKEAGTNARIDVTRSLVELQTQKQRLNALEADLRKQKITLARVTGLPQDRALNLTEALGGSAANVPDVSSALQQALTNRADVKASEAQLHAAEIALSAAHAERLPSVSLGGDYGALGPNPANAHGVFAVTGTVNIPVWQGGRVKADIEQAEATVAQRRAELADQKARVEQEVRNALIEFQTAAGQVELARTNRNYARETLTQARDRFAAGVSTTLEVVQAQEQVAAAESDYISSLFALNIAQLSFARASGQAESSIPNLLNEEHR